MTKSLAEITFYNGFVIRQMFAFMKTYVGDFQFRCYENILIIHSAVRYNENYGKNSSYSKRSTSFQDSKHQHACIAKFFANDLLKYKISQFDSIDSDGVPYLQFSPNSTTFYNNVTQCSKKDTLNLEIVIDQNGKLSTFINLSKPGITSRTRSCCETIECRSNLLEGHDMFQGKEPNIKLPLADFSSVCASIGGIKTKSIKPVIVTYPEGLSIYAENLKKESVKDSYWGNCEDKPLFSHNISIEINNVFASLSNITEMGVVSMYFDKSTIMISIAVGSCGRLKVFMKTLANETEENIEDNEDYDDEHDEIDDMEL